VPLLSQIHDNNGETHRGTTNQLPHTGNTSSDLNVTEEQRPFVVNRGRRERPNPNAT